MIHFSCCPASWRQARTVASTRGVLARTGGRVSRKSSAPKGAKTKRDAGSSIAPEFSVYFPFHVPAYSFAIRTALSESSEVEPKAQTITEIVCVQNFQNVAHRNDDCLHP